MTINIEEIIERTFEKTFVRLLEQAIQAKVEARLKKAFEKKEDFLAEEIEGLIEQAFHRTVHEKIVWDKQETGITAKETGITKLNLTEGEHL
ncbi:MAG TPA: hypothetical protein VMG10_12555 [Gemmataceae bacterium]|nr:hypothetical protein [Gemmataceae bacterium]